MRNSPVYLPIHDWRAMGQRRNAAEARARRITAALNVIAIGVGVIFATVICAACLFVATF